MLPRYRKDSCALYKQSTLPGLPRELYLSELFEDGWEEDQTLRLPVELPLLLAYGSATAHFLGSWRSPLPRPQKKAQQSGGREGANLSCSKYDNWGHLRVLGAECQQVAKAREMGRSSGAGAAKRDWSLSPCPRNNRACPPEQHLQPALPSFLLRYQRVSSRLPLGVQK